MLEETRQEDHAHKPEQRVQAMSEINPGVKMDVGRAARGKDWKLVEGMAVDELLLVRDFSAAARRMRWVLMDPASRSAFQLPLHSQPNATHPLRMPGTGDIVYSSERGITSFNVFTGRERLLWEMDNALESVERMWLFEGSLYFVHGRRQVSLDDVAAKALRQGTIQTEDERAYSLYSLAMAPKARPRLMTTFAAAPFCAAIDRRTGGLFVAMDDRALLRVDLESSKTTREERSPELVGVLVSPRNTLVRWGFGDSGIQERGAAGRYKALTRFGRSPAFAPDGERMAFLRNSEELWILGAPNQTAELIVRYPPSGCAALNEPVWCPCGNHLSVLLVASGAAKGRRQALVIVDAAKKAVEIIPPPNEASFNGGQVWLPRDSG